MNDEPFSYRNGERPFLEAILRAMAAEVNLPKDGQWHRVRLTFDVFCPKEGSGFMLRNDNAG